MIGLHPFDTKHKRRKKKWYKTFKIPFFDSGCYSQTQEATGNFKVHKECWDAFQEAANNPPVAPDEVCSLVFTKAFLAVHYAQSVTDIAHSS